MTERNKWHWDINTPYVQFKSDLPVIKGDRLITIRWDHSLKVMQKRTTIAMEDGVDFYEFDGKKADPLKIRRFGVMDSDNCFFEYRKDDNYEDRKYLKEFPFNSSL